MQIFLALIVFLLSFSVIAFDDIEKIIQEVNITTVYSYDNFCYYSYNKNNDTWRKRYVKTDKTCEEYIKINKNLYDVNQEIAILPFSGETKVFDNSGKILSIYEYRNGYKIYKNDFNFTEDQWFPISHSKVSYRGENIWSTYLDKNFKTELSKKYSIKNNIINPEKVRYHHEAERIDFYFQNNLFLILKLTPWIDNFTISYVDYNKKLISPFYETNLNNFYYKIEFKNNEISKIIEYNKYTKDLKVLNFKDNKAHGLQLRTNLIFFEPQTNDNLNIYWSRSKVDFYVDGKKITEYYLKNNQLESENRYNFETNSIFRISLVSNKIVKECMNNEFNLLDSYLFDTENIRIGRDDCNWGYNSDYTEPLKRAFFKNNILKNNYFNNEFRDIIKSLKNFK